VSDQLHVPTAYTGGVEGEGEGDLGALSIYRVSQEEMT